jgi:hypothetical protein
MFISSLTRERKSLFLGFLIVLLVMLPALSGAQSGKYPQTIVFMTSA